MKSILCLILQCFAVLSIYAESPKLTLLTPGDMTFQIGQEISIIAEVEDTDLSSVEFIIDGEVLKTLSTEPFTFDWKTEALGEYELTVRATDDIGNSTEQSIQLTSLHLPARSVLRNISNHTIRSVVKYNSYIYALTMSGIVFKSLDLEKWEVCLDPGIDYPQSLQVSMDTVCAVGDAGFYFVKPDESGAWDYRKIDGISSSFPESYGSHHLAYLEIPTGSTYIHSRDMLHWKTLENPDDDSHYSRYGEFNGRLLLAAINQDGVNDYDINSSEIYSLNNDYSWQKHNLPIPGKVISFLSDNDRLVVLVYPENEQTPYPRLFSTNDWNTWNEHPIQLPEEYQDYLEVKYWSSIEKFEDVYVLTFKKGRTNAEIFTTTDLGSAWTRIDGIRELYDIEKSGSIYYASCFPKSIYNHIKISYDGENWEDYDHELRFPYLAFKPLLLSVPGGLMIHNATPSFGTIAYVKPTGKEWEELTPNDSDSTGRIVDYAAGNGIHFAIGPNANLRSTDKVTWSQLPHVGNVNLSVAFGNGVFVVGTEDAAVNVSADALSWESHILHENTSIETRGVHFLEGPDIFIASDSNTTVYWISEDGTSWTQYDVPSRFALQNIHTINGIVYAQSRSADISSRKLTAYKSIDGINWTETYTSSGKDITPVYNKGIYVKADSEIGISWSNNTERWNAAGVFASYVAPIDSGFLAGTGPGVYKYISPDGKKWFRIAEGPNPSNGATSFYFPGGIDPNPIDGHFYSFRYAFKQYLKDGIEIHTQNGKISATVRAYGHDPNPIEQSTDLKNWESLLPGNIGIRTLEKTIEYPEGTERVFIRQKRD